MGRTVTEKILAAHAGKDRVEPGEWITAKVDFVMCNDNAGRIGRELEAMGAGKVFDPERVLVVQDHDAPNKDLASAEHGKSSREFVRKFGIKHFYEVGRGGIAHPLMAQEGFALPGMLIVGSDSHICTYGTMGCFSTGMGYVEIAAVLALGETWFKVPPSIKFVLNGKRRPWVVGKDLILFVIGQIGIDGALYQAMEWHGEALRDLPVNDRLTMTNMAVEAGAKNGIFPVDEITRRYLQGRARFPYTVYESDPDAHYTAVCGWDISRLGPQVAKPFKPDNVVPVEELASLTIDQVFIGSCTNGYLADLRAAAQIMRGKKVHPEVRMIVIPGTYKIYLEALKEGLMEIFAEAGAAIGPATCGPCPGGHMGILAAGERCVSTSNRNFPGRMGHPKSEVYLANAAVAAASAIKGRITHPEEVLV